jgi:hypothetical protein
MELQQGCNVGEDITWASSSSQQQLNCVSVLLMEEGLATMLLTHRISEHQQLRNVWAPWQLMHCTQCSCESALT